MNDEQAPNIMQYESIEESAEELYQTAPAGYLSLLLDGTIIRVNQTLLTWLSLERDEVLGKLKFTDLLTPGGKIHYEVICHPLFLLQGKVREVNYALTHRNQESIPVLVNFVVVKMHKRNETIVRATIFDITFRKKYETELIRERKIAEDATEAKANFLSAISHEIRTPINGLMGMTELLLDTGLTEIQLDYVETIRSSAEHLLAVVSEVLEYSKLEAGKVTLESLDFVASTLIHELVKPLVHLALKKGINLHVENAPDLPHFLKGDPTRIRQILLNLLSNALKFTEQGEIVVRYTLISTSQTEAVLELSVKDSGIGMSDSAQESLFKAFTQADSSTHRIYGGTGLGLTICKGIVQIMGGSISVSSSLGIGTTFVVKIPLAVSSEPVIRKSS